MRRNLTNKKTDASLGRLRRSEDGGFQRKEKPGKKRYSEDRTTPHNERQSIRRTSRAIHSDNEESVASPSRTSHLGQTSPAFSVSLSPHGARLYATPMVTLSTEPLAVQKLQAELEVAEAELKAARLKYQYIQEKERAEKQAQVSGDGS